MKQSRILTLLVVMLIAAFVAMPAMAADPNPGKGSADVSVMNTENGASQVSAEYYDQTGNLAATKNQPLAAYGSYQFKAADSGLPDNWKGSMVVSSTTDVASLATIHWRNGSAGDGIEADSYSGFSSGATRMNLPFVVYAPNAQYTVFSVQNTESAQASITMKYYNRNGSLDFTVTDTIPANGQAAYDMHTPGAKVPVWTNSSYYNSNGNWTGAVIIETGSATQKIAVVANNFWPAYSVAYNASTAGATKLFIPSVERRLQNGGASAADQLGFSVVIVQNLGASATNLTFKFVNKDTGNTDATISVPNVGGGAAVGCNTRIGAQCSASQVAGLGDTWVGSVVVESSSQQVTAISYSIRPRDNEAGSTTGASTNNAGLSTYLAEVYRIGSGTSFTVWSLLRLQNVSGSDANGVVVKFMNRDGSEIAAARQTINVPAEKSFNFNLRFVDATPALANLGSNWSGGVQITSPQPLAVVTENLWGLSEMAAYNGYSK